MIRRYVYGTKMLVRFDGARSSLSLFLSLSQCLSACGNVLVIEHARFHETRLAGSRLLPAPSHRQRSRRSGRRTRRFPLSRDNRSMIGAGPAILLQRLFSYSTLSIGSRTDNEFAKYAGGIERIRAVSWI